MRGIGVLILRHPCGATITSSLKYEEFLKEVAKGIKCSHCGKMFGLAMTSETAEKHGVGDSPYIKVTENPGRWYRKSYARRAYNGQAK